MCVVYVGCNKRNINHTNIHENQKANICYGCLLHINVGKKLRNHENVFFLLFYAKRPFNLYGYLKIFFFV